jgi:SAM-dependent methyltransferase
VPPADRDAWLDRVLGLGELPDDDPELPSGCVPYLPCPVDALLRVVDHGRIRPSDVFVDLGSGLGRATALVHLLTGAAVIGLEIQPRLVVAARDLATRLVLSRASYVEGDAAKLAGFLTIGSVFFLYCPFSGERLAKVVAELESIARTRTIRVCCVDVPMPACPWLAPEPPVSANLAVYRSTLSEGDRGSGASAHPCNPARRGRGKLVP